MLSMLTCYVIGPTEARLPLMSVNFAIRLTKCIYGKTYHEIMVKRVPKSAIPCQMVNFE